MGREANTIDALYADNRVGNHFANNEVIVRVVVASRGGRSGQHSANDFENARGSNYIWVEVSISCYDPSPFDVLNRNGHCF